MRFVSLSLIFALFVACGQRSSDERKPPCTADADCRAFGDSFSGHVCNSLGRCVIDLCGYGEVEAGEACDDGNQIDTDTCTRECLQARCGDGIVQDGIEACDDGNGDYGDGCTTDCALPGCGDGFVQEGEGCDDGNASDIDACTSRCFEARCGDGLRREDLEEGVDGYEACDDGNTRNNDACTTECGVPVCGDGYVRPAPARDQGRAQ